MSVSLNTPKCEHCKAAMAFGTFKVQTTRRGEVLMALCADCGFNITKFSVSRLARVIETDWLSREVEKEFMYRFQPYKSAVLIEVFSDTQKLMVAYREAEKRDQARVKPVAAPRQLREAVVLAPSTVSPRRKTVAV